MAALPRLSQACLNVLGGVMCLGLPAIAAPATYGAREAAPVQAPAPESPPAAEPTAPAVPRPLAAADIPLESMRLDARLNEIGLRLRPDPAVRAIEREFPAEMASLHSLGETASPARLESLTLRHLEQIQQPWNLHRTRLDRWQSTIRVRTKEAEALHAEVQSLRDVWKMTGGDLAAVDPRSSLHASVQEAIAAIELLHGRLSTRLQELIALQGRIAEGMIAISRTLEGIETARAEARQRLFRIDRPPLWNEVAGTGEGSRLIDQVRRSWVADWRIVAGFMSTHRQTAALHLLLFVLFGVLLSAMRRAGRQWPTDNPDIRAARPVLDRPYSAAILLGLILTFFLYDEAPARLHEVALLAALVPCLRVLPAIFGPAVDRPLAVASALFVLDRLTALLFDAPILYRLLLLATTLGALLALLLVFRRGLPGFPAPPGSWRPLSIGMGRTAVVILGISVVANVWGNITLAQILTDGTLRSGYLTVMLYAVTLIIDGLVAFVLGLRACRTLRMVSLHFDLIRVRLRTVIRVALVVLWVALTLDLFALLTPVVAGVRAGLTHRWTVGTVAISMGDIVAFVVALWISTLLARFVSFTLESELMPRLGVGRGVPEAVALLTRNFILVVGFFLAMAAAGIEVGRFSILVGALGVGVGFGLQNVVNNFISGLILAFERPIHVGDTIEVGPLLGRVMTIGFRSSTVRTYEGADVIVPNSNLISSELVNWTFSDQTRRVEIKIGVAYGSDPRRVLEVLTQAARDRPDILKSPEPLALFRGFGDSSLDFSLWFWTGEFQRWREVASQTALAIHDGLDRAGVAVPFPQRDLHLRSVDPGAARTLRDGGA